SNRDSSVPGLASKPVCKIAVFAFDVPVPTSFAASTSTQSSAYADSVRAIAVPTTPAPMITTSAVLIAVLAKHRRRRGKPLLVRQLHQEEWTGPPSFPAQPGRPPQPPTQRRRRPP